MAAAEGGGPGGESEANLAAQAALVALLSYPGCQALPPRWRVP
jgi:hypothetical protein